MSWPERWLFAPEWVGRRSSSNRTVNLASDNPALRSAHSEKRNFLCRIRVQTRSSRARAGRGRFTLNSRCDLRCARGRRATRLTSADSAAIFSPCSSRVVIGRSPIKPISAITAVDVAGMNSYARMHSTGPSSSHYWAARAPSCLGSRKRGGGLSRGGSLAIATRRRKPSCDIWRP